MPRLGEAIPLLRALASSYPDFVPLLGESLNTIGGLEASLSKWDDAGPHFEEAERVERPLAEKNLIQFGPMLGMIYNNLAAYHQLKGNYPEAERYAQNAVEVRKRLASSEASFQPLVLNSLFSLAALYRAQKKWLEATRTSEEALAISRRLPMTSTNQIVVADNSVVWLPQRLERATEMKQALT